ncbi:MAG: hypothetical protein GOMPHAMPRED_007149 [Gomphillus americanus]|uniref:Tyrosine--tRNA ligase n=1 Tax=Gomphillus americanus TaxID=1940652 RepID=A0A8H3IYN8_9LECA|nr:MAG: hypothetical protein GOMPHAMPRED_007149 [Gomphillus americanus]
MAQELSGEQKIALIKEQLQEVLRLDIIEDVILKQNRPLRIYWGTAPTGRPHCGYFVPMVKIAHFLRAGCHVKVLLADIHGFLDNLKAPIELVKFRAEYYQFVVKSLLKSINVPIERLEFRLGSTHQLTQKYTMDIFRLSSVVTEHDAKRAGAEVVKQVDNAPLSGLIYPLMQALDEEHLDVDVQFGGVDQRKIFVLAAEQLPKIGYKERGHLMNRMVPGLAGGKMSSSDPDSKIDILDTPEAIKKKIKKAYAVPKEIEGNGMISFVEYVLLPLTPQLLKAAVTSALTKLLEPIQADYLASQEWQNVEKNAYPAAPEPPKKPKKAKKLGTRHPGASTAPNQIEVQPDGQIKGQDVENPTPTEVSDSAADAIKKLGI